MATGNRTTKDWSKAVRLPVATSCNQSVERPTRLLTWKIQGNRTQSVWLRPVQSGPVSGLLTSWQLDFKTLRGKGNKAINNCKELAKLSRDLVVLVEDNSENEDSDHDEANNRDDFTPTSFSSCPATNLFTISSCLQEKNLGTVIPLPFYLRATLADYLVHDKAQVQPVIHTIGGPCQASRTTVLPFSDMQIWVKVRIQNLPLHNQDIAPPQTLFACPPEEKWTVGRYDAAIINVEAGNDWPLNCWAKLELTGLGRTYFLFTFNDLTYAGWTLLRNCQSLSVPREVMANALVTLFHSVKFRHLPTSFHSMKHLQTPG
ncbi:hypothetical protein OG21DRAFT_1527897 [Imleria badia]|nr:hypothetical protein OG21DRAFT_1527897 [Imleria badia]